MGSLRAARALCEAARSDSCLVGLSGGKDSLAVLDICMSVFKHVECYAMYLVPGLRCVEESIQRATARYGVTVHPVPDWFLGQAIRAAIYRPHVYQAMGWRATKAVHVEATLRKQTGITWIAYGHRMDESLERRGMLHSISGFDEKGSRIYPIWDWSAADVWSYLRARKVQPPPSLGGGHAVRLNTACFKWLREHYPDDLERIYEYFPFSRAILKREEFLERRAKQ